MEKQGGAVAKVLFRLALISLALAIYTRVFHFQGTEKAALPWFGLGITADAFLRFTNTILYFAIAWMLYQLLPAKSSERKTEKTEEKKD